MAEGNESETKREEFNEKSHKNREFNRKFHILFLRFLKLKLLGNFVNVFLVGRLISK